MNRTGIELVDGVNACEAVLANLFDSHLRTERTMSLGLFKFGWGRKSAPARGSSARLRDIRGGGKGYFLSGNGQYTHEVVRLQRSHSALVCGDGAGGLILGSLSRANGSCLGLGGGRPRIIIGRDFLARLVETRPDGFACNRIAVHIAGDCIGFLPPSLSSIYAEWADDWRLTETLILCKARVLIKAREGGRARPVAQVMLDIARPFQIRAFGR